MKKYIFLFVLIFCCTGCTIDYSEYYKKYGDIYNKDDRLKSENIEPGTLNYPLDNSSHIEKYNSIYYGLRNEYRIYSTYYSQNYDTLYISYDSIENPIQTIDSRELALMEEHLLNYFISDSAKTDYSKYLKVVRIYPDYASSACRSENESEEEYSKTEGCADYNAKEAAINLNNLNHIKRFFNEHTYIQDNIQYTTEPKRDTFAHEFGHISTYYNMILKGEGNYEDYLKLRLGDSFYNVYPSGLPDKYSSSHGYNIQPVEILADDYVEMYYNTDEKMKNDYYEYPLEYNDLRNSLSKVDGVVQYLKSDQVLFEKMKEYYNKFINNKNITFEEPIVIKATGNAYFSINDIENDNKGLSLEEKQLVVLGELKINDSYYYKVILSNLIGEINARGEYEKNIGYIQKSDCEVENLKTLRFDYYDGAQLQPNQFLLIEEYYLQPYYDFSCLILENDKIKIYNYLDDDFNIIERDSDIFLK